MSSGFVMFFFSLPGQRDQCGMTFVHGDWLTGAQARAVAGEQQLADLIGLDVDLRLSGGKDGTGREVSS
jgi:hypothetical protein